MSSYLDFNPRPREEGDVILGLDFVKKDNFNPRPREEGYMRFISADKNSFYFNPRPREEGDFNINAFLYPDFLFQSTPS